MPSNKPKIVAYTEQETLDKFRIIAQEYERSVSQETIYLIKQEIKKYEAEHGEIKIKN